MEFYGALKTRAYLNMLIGKSLQYKSLTKKDGRKDICKYFMLVG